MPKKPPRGHFQRRIWTTFGLWRPRGLFRLPGGSLMEPHLAQLGLPWTVLKPIWAPWGPLGLPTGPWMSFRTPGASLGLPEAPWTSLRPPGGPLELPEAPGAHLSLLGLPWGFLKVPGVHLGSWTARFPYVCHMSPTRHPYVSRTSPARHPIIQKQSQCRLAWPDANMAAGYGEPYDRAHQIESRLAWPVARN